MNLNEFKEQKAERSIELLNQTEITIWPEPTKIVLIILEIAKGSGAVIVFNIGLMSWGYGI